MKNVKMVLCSAVIAISFGCTYIGPKGEYTAGSGALVFKKSATLIVKVEGEGERAEISHFTIKKEDEDTYTSNFSSGSPESAIDKTFKANMKSFTLPWSMELTLEADELLYIQVRPIDITKGAVRLEILKDGGLEKEYSISNGMIPFWTTYRL